MAKFGKSSLKRLKSIDIKLQTILLEAIELTDFSVISGYRGEREQNELVLKGFSQLNFPRSKHNKVPSQAVDIAPWNSELKGIDWNDIESFKHLAYIIKEIAHKHDVKLIWGGDWESFKDYPHFELSF